MNTPLNITKRAKYLVTLSVFGLSLCVTHTQAQIVDTETLVNNHPAAPERSQLQNTVNREEVKTKLQALGVDPAELQQRVDALSDAEAQALANNIDSLPAGGKADTVTVLLLIIIIILLI